MNGSRIKYDDSPEGRIAAVAKYLCVHFEENHIRTGVGPKEPDYADFKVALRPFIQRELLKARIDEARTTQSRILTDRVMELAKELAIVEAQIPKELRPHE